MNRRTFFSAIVGTPAAAAIANAAPAPPRSIKVEYAASVICECGYAMYMSVDGKEVNLTCRNAACRNHPRRFRPPNTTIFEAANQANEKIANIAAISYGQGFRVSSQQMEELRAADAAATLARDQRREREELFISDVFSRRRD